MDLMPEGRAWTPVRALPAAMRRALPWSLWHPHKVAPTAASTAIFGQAIFAKSRLSDFNKLR